MTGVKMSEMTADTSVAGTEKLLVLDGTTSKTLTTAKMAEYSIDVLVAAASATPTTGDTLLAVRSSAEKNLSLDAVVTYVTAETWSDASAVTPLTTGDLFLMNRSDVTGKATIDSIKTYVLTGVQATVLDYSGLTAATLAGTDLFAVCQTTTGKKVTLSNLETKLWTDYATYVSGLTFVTSLSDSDVLYCLDGGVAKQITAEVLSEYMEAEIGANIVDDVWDDASVLTATQDGDVYVFERSGARKAINAEYVADYVIAEFGAEAGAGATQDGDKVAVWRSSTPGTMTVDAIATYVKQAVVDDYAVVTPVLGTDYVLLNRSSVGKQALLSAVKTYVLTDIQETVLDSSTLSAVALPVTTDLFFLDRSGVPYKCTLANIETQLWTDFATYTGALADIATLADADKFYVLRSGTPKHCTAVEMATYVAAEIWAFSAATLTGTDKFFVYSGSANKTTTLDDIATYVLTDAQETILDLSTLTVASGITGTDTLLLCQGSDPYYVTLATLGEEVLDDLPAHLDALGAVTTPADADLLYCLQGGVAKKLALSDLAIYTADQANEFPWTEIPGANYNSTPSSTSVLLMTDTTGMAVGLPVKYTIGGNVYYALVTAVSANTSITIAGAPLSGTTTNLHVGPTSGVVHEHFFLDTAYGASVQDLFADLTYRSFRWPRAKAYLVQFSAAHGVVDTGAAQPKINVKAGGNAVWTNDSSKGLQLSGSVGTWTDSSAVALNTTYYAVDRNEAIDVRCTEVGTNGDADCLSITLVFVYE
jgi:hypothetical protein